MGLSELEYITDWKKNVGSSNPPPDLIEDIVADTNEISAITGRSEIGKTNFCLQLAYSLATGTPFLGHKVAEPVTVAYIGFEGDEHQLLKRIEKIEKHFPVVLGTLYLKVACPIFKLEGNKLGEFRNLISGSKVIIIDPVRYIVPGDYLDPKYATRFMETLQDEMRRNGSLAIVVFYHKKMDSVKLMEPGDLWQIKGATEWGDMCSTVLMLERTRQKSIGGRGAGMGFQQVNKDNVTLYFAKTRNALGVLDPIDLLFNRSKCIFEMV